LIRSRQGSHEPRRAFRSSDQRFPDRWRANTQKASGLWFDFRASARSLTHQLAFSLGVILTFALGLSVNAAVFSFLDRVYLARRWA